MRLILNSIIKISYRINYINKSESLMSFQETLVSKKQKNKKKNTQKTKIATSASLSQQKQLN